MHQVDVAISENKSLAWIEEHIIDPPALDEEMKASLWLYAWVMLPQADHSQATRTHLARL
jgi:hypothetical protein